MTGTKHACHRDSDSRGLWIPALTGIWVAHPPQRTVAICWLQRRCLGGRQRTLLAVNEKPGAEETINTCKCQQWPVVLCAEPSVYHDVDFEFAFLNDGCTAQGQTLIGVMILKNFPHGCHQAGTPSSSLGLHLQHLGRHSCYKVTRVRASWRGQSLHVNVYCAKCWEHTWSRAEVHALEGY